MNRWKKMNDQGLSFVEALISMVILLMVFTVASESLLRGRQYWLVSAMQTKLNHAAKVSIDYMVSELKNATRNESASPPNLVIDISREIMDFYLPTDIDSDGYIVDSSGNTEWDTTTTYQYQFDSDTNRLYRIQDANTRILAINVASVVFDDITTDSTLLGNEICITLTLQDTDSAGRAITVTRTSRVGLRN